MYSIVRNIHLLLASFSLPFLLMYGVSAVQMSHNTWFQMRPSVQERQVALTPGQADARAVAREMMEREPGVRGEVSTIQPTPRGVSLRLVLPGTVHDIQYDRATGAAKLKTSVAGFMGMLNRLHHAAGLWHEPASLRAWAMLVALVSAALLLVGASGIYMWFTRRPERRVGVVLLAVNALFAIAVLTLMRSAGP